MRREKRSSPYWKMASASSRSVDRATRSAAVSPPLRSMRMSSGSSRWKLKPRPGASNCSDDTPRSASAPSTRSIWRPIEDVVDRAIVGVHQLDAIAPRRQRFAGAGERVEVAIEADEARRARFEQRARVAAEADGAVDEQAAVAFGPQSSSSDLGGHDRDVGHQMPNSESARASSSVYGSRCSLVRKRSWFQTSR